MPAVIAKSCNKLMIGKTYWKSAALPAILHGTEVTYLNKKHINKLQTNLYNIEHIQNNEIKKRVQDIDILIVES